MASWSGFVENVVLFALDTQVFAIVLVFRTNRLKLWDILVRNNLKEPRQSEEVRTTET